MSVGSERLKNLANLWRRKRPEVGATPHDVVWAENKWRLLRYRSVGVPLTGEPLLLIPSLINRHYVLDLMAGKSFTEWMLEQGRPIYTIDWGTPGPEDRYLTFDDICDGYIGRALRKTREAAGTNRVHVLGYCMGGTLATIHAAAHPGSMASLIALAAPVSFNDGGMLSDWVRTDGFDLGATLKAYGNMPAQLMQASFHLLRPTLTLSKAMHVIDRAWNDPFLDGFLAIETWSNDNVSFPGECYRRYITDLYQADQLVRGEFTLSGRPARLANITCPTLVITFADDSIVPLASAQPLVDQVGAKDVTALHLRGGHVGAVVSSSARKNLWPTLESWVEERDQSAFNG